MGKSYGQNSKTKIIKYHGKCLSSLHLNMVDVTNISKKMCIDRLNVEEGIGLSLFEGNFICFGQSLEELMGNYIYLKSQLKL